MFVSIQISTTRHMIAYIYDCKNDDGGKGYAIENMKSLTFEEAKDSLERLVNKKMDIGFNDGKLEAYEV